MPDDRIRVMHLLTSFEVGGAEIVALNLAAGMDRSRFSVCACSLNGPGPIEERFRDAGVETFTLAPGGDGLAGRIGPVRRLARLMKDRGVSVLHCHNTMPLICGAFAGRLARTPTTVCTRHALNPRRRPGWPWRLERFAGRFTACQIAVSPGVLERGLAMRRMPRDRSCVIYNAIDTERFTPPASRPERRETVFGCVARLSEEKRHCDLLLAVGILRNRGRDVSFRLIGDGACRPDLERQAHELGIEDRVEFLGTRDDVPALLRDLDVFVLPSRTEGLPLSVLEAMASGLPVVATRVGSLHEIVREGRTGLLVEAMNPQALAAALERLVLDRALRLDMGREARRVAETEFSLKRAVEQHEALYLELLRKKRGRRSRQGTRP